MPIRLAERLDSCKYRTLCCVEFLSIPTFVNIFLYAPLDCPARGKKNFGWLNERDVRTETHCFCLNVNDEGVAIETQKHNALCEAE